jgi:Arc/MetJ family transcription regulator
MWPVCGLFLDVRASWRCVSKLAPTDISASVAKRLIDVDDDKLAAVKAELGTKTIKATVDGALDEVLALAARRRALLAEGGVDTSSLADRDARRAAWG